MLAADGGASSPCGLSGERDLSCRSEIQLVLQQHTARCVSADLQLFTMMSPPDSCSSVAPDKAVHTGVKSPCLNVHMKVFMSRQCCLVYQDETTLDQIFVSLTSQQFKHHFVMPSCARVKPGSNAADGASAPAAAIAGWLLFFWVYHECFLSAHLFRWVLRRTSHEPGNKWRRN